VEDEEKNEVRRAYSRREHWEERVKLAEWWAGQILTYRVSSDA
jgi:hypothetical protein